MQRIYRQRPLAYEQLESKAAPSSILMVVSGEATHPEWAGVATHWLAVHASPAGYERLGTDDILQFVADNTSGGERAHREATRPTAAECAAADEMMTQIPDEWNSLLVLGFYEDGVEL